MTDEVSIWYFMIDDLQIEIAREHLVVVMFYPMHHISEYHIVPGKFSTFLVGMTMTSSYLCFIVWIFVIK